MAKHMIINTRDKMIAPLSVEMEISKICDFFCGGIGDDGIIIDGLFISELFGVTVSNIGTSDSVVSIIVLPTI
jgi:hypothetical protein